jgi:hypothetical protein
LDIAKHGAIMGVLILSIFPKANLLRNTAPTAPLYLSSDESKDSNQNPMLEYQELLSVVEVYTTEFTNFRKSLLASANLVN